MDPKNAMWVEKYRPKILKDVVGDSKFKVQKYLDNHEQMPHLLLYSTTPGTGKTATAKIIIKELGDDALILNSSDDRKIETIREKVNGFVKSKSANLDYRRVVFLDEADGLTYVAQDALRNLMETYSSNAIFILTCNNINKISDAIQSRCVKISFMEPDKKEIYKYLENICINEQLEYDSDGLNEIINANYPSIRNCVQVLQSLYTENKKIIAENAKKSDDVYNMLWNKLYVDKDWKSIQEYLFKNDIDISQLNKSFWYNAVNISNIKLIQITCANELRLKDGDPLVVFVTSLLEMVNAVR